MARLSISVFFVVKIFRPFAFSFCRDKKPGTIFSSFAASVGEVERGWSCGGISRSA
jgi:hypothetical protein